MFLTSICPSSGVQVVCCCIWCSARSQIQTYKQCTKLHTSFL